MSDPNKSRPAPKAGDFVAGAGGGGILVYLAQHFIMEPSLSQAAVYACPALSMFFVGLYQKLSTFVLQQWTFYVGEIERKRLLKRSDENIDDCRRKLELAKADQGANASHVAQLRANLEAMEISHLQLRLRGSVTVTDRA